MTLNAIPPGVQVLVDANILIYAKRGMSTQCRQFLERCFLVLAIDVPDLAKALELQHAHGLLTNDSLHLAAGLRASVNLIATADPQFDQIPDLQVAKPDDLRCER